MTVLSLRQALQFGGSERFARVDFTFRPTQRDRFGNADHSQYRWWRGRSTEANAVREVRLSASTKVRPATILVMRFFLPIDLSSTCVDIVPRTGAEPGSLTEGWEQSSNSLGHPI